MKACSLLTLVLLLSGTTGCSTLRGRFLVGSSLGAIAGGAAGYGLSPNPESRGINALVFGLLGMFVGGGLGVLTTPEPKIPSSESSLKEKEKTARLGEDTKVYAVPIDAQLPEFLKKRLSPVVVGESKEADTVSEDGTLHEPHKTYRIVRPAELYSQPEATPGIKK